MMNMVKSSLQIELDDFFKVIEGHSIAVRKVTDSAFCQARNKFSYHAFIELNQVLCTAFYKNAKIKLWCGFRLLAVDGSTVTLPNCDRQKRLLNYFGKIGRHAKAPCLRLSELYDVLNRVSVDVQTSTYKEGERLLAFKHLKSGARKGDMVLYDRGYPAFWLFAYHMQENIHFCARAASNATGFVTAFIASGEQEGLAMYSPDDKAIKEATVRQIDATPFPVRLIRVELPCGEIEVLMTSLLTKKTYPHAMFMALYHERWFIEEDYKTTKSRMELENFTGLTVESVYQDIHAKSLSKNIVALAAFDAEPIVAERYKGLKYPYQINFSKALSKFKDSIVVMTRCAKKAMEYIGVLLWEIALNAYAVRAGRKNKRDANSLKYKKRGFSMAYKRTK